MLKQRKIRAATVVIVATIALLLIMIYAPAQIIAP
jgi:hypothetical protein